MTPLVWIRDRLLQCFACSLLLVAVLAGAAPAQESTSGFGSSTADDSADPVASTFHKCILTARQVGSDKMEGSIELLPHETSQGASAAPRLTIGRTNLEQLKLSSGGRRIEVGADAGGNLIPLSDSPLAAVRGTWERSGTAIGETTSWRFLLPSVAVCEIKLETDPGTSVTSPDALVIPVPTLSGKAKWRLLPRNPRDVTIRCSGTNAESARNRTLSLTGDIAIDSNSLSGNWVVTIDEFRAQKSLRLRFSSPCKVTDVTLADKSKTKWNYNESKRELQIQLPSNVPADSLRIAIGREKDDGARRELPIPTPVQPGAPREGVPRANRIRLQSSTLRVRVASSLLVAGHELRGLYERDITWASDGLQTLDLVQFDTAAKAVLLTTSSLAILDDSTFTLFNPDSSPDEAVVFLEVSAKAGSTGRLDYRIPAEWQVKDVSEVASGQLLLFKMLDDDRGRQQRRFTTWLRSPLTPNASQRLKLNLLSTEYTSAGRFSPRIISSTSRREELFITTDSSDLSGFGFIPVDQETTVPDWIPTAVADDAQIYVPGTRNPRTARAEPASPLPEQEEDDSPKDSSEPQEETRQNIAGTSFQILTQTGAAPQVECLARLHVDTGSAISFGIPNVTSIQTFVNGSICYATSRDSTFHVPLDAQTAVNVVDVYFTATSAVESDRGIAIPTIRPVTDGNATVSTLLALSEDLQPIAQAGSGQSTVSMSAVRELPQDVYRGETPDELNIIVQSFRSRWNLCPNEFAMVINPAIDDEEVLLSLHNPVFNSTALFLWSAGCGLCWLAMIRKGWLSLTGQGICLLSLSVAAFFASAPLSRPLQGMALALLIVAVAFGSVRTLRRALRGRTPKLLIRRTVAGPTVLIVLLAANAVQGDEAIAEHEALIISCKIAVTLESRQSAMAVVECMTAFPPGKAGRLEVPLDRFTLIDCQVEGKSTLPKRIGDGLLQLLIPATQPEPAEDSETEDPGWSRKKTTYTIRGVPQWTAGICRLQIPHPVAPATSVSLTDETGLISSATLRGTDVSSRLMGTGRWEFDGASGQEALDLELTGEQAADSSDDEQVVAIQCEADVSPPDLKLATTYTFSDTGIAGDIVRIGTAPQYRITAIEDRSGNNLTWSMNEDSVIVQLDTETDRRSLVVRQAGELPLKLKQKISVGELLMVDNRSAADTTLRVRTSDRFFVDSVIAGTESLARSDTSGTTPTATFRIDSATKEILVSLQELRPSREASILQTATVDGEEIRWSAECRLSIKVQPVYRQQIQLSRSVDLTEITAERDGASLIQAWTRNQDKLVIAFREATRGEVVLRLAGVIKRSAQSDTRLPAISLPDADVQEANLEISAAENTVAMIGEAGSAIPDVDFDPETDPLPNSFLRMTLRDESQPPGIRRTPQRRLSIDSALAVYELGDQPFVAELLLLRPEDSRFETRFRLRSDRFAGIQPLVFRNGQSVDITEEGGEYVVPRLEQGQEEPATTIVLPHLDVVQPSGKIVTHVPDFDTETRISSWSVFDFRDDRPQQVRDALPEWLRSGLQIAEVVPEASGTKLRNFDFDNSAMVFRGQVAMTSTRPEERRNRVLSAFGTHLIQLGDSTGVVRSDFLLFAADESPEASLLLPFDTQVLELRVNGRATTLRKTGAYCNISADEKINHVSMKWVGKLQPGQEGMRLPVVANVVSENIAVLTQPEAEGEPTWALQNARLTATEFDSLRAESIRKNLRLVDPALPADEISLNADSAFWEQMSNSSPKAAISFRESLKAVRSSVASSEDIVNAADRSLALSKPLRPTILQYAGMIIGGLLVAVSLLKPAKAKPAAGTPKTSLTELSESATVEVATESSESAVSNGELPDDSGNPDGSTVAGKDV